MNRYFCLFLALIFVLSCASVGYDSSKLKSFHKIIAEETQKVSIYDGFQSRAFIKVIYRSRDLRKLYVDSLAEMESLTDSEKDAIMQKEMEENNKYFEFCVVLSTTEFKTNDLDSIKSIWRVFIEDSSGAREYPLEIREVKVDQKIRLLYPGVSRFGKFYKIKFEKKDRIYLKGVKLIFSSVAGKAVFKY